MSEETLTKKALPDNVQYSSASVKSGQKPILRTHRCGCGAEIWGQLTAPMKAEMRINNLECDECGGTMFGSLVISGDRYKEWRPRFVRSGDGDLNDAMISIFKYILGKKEMFTRYGLRSPLYEAIGSF